ncbi:MAG: peptidoglycan-binding protein, partial [Patescibacteria group bacterium]
NGGGYWYRGRTESVTWSSTNIQSNDQVLIRLRSISTNQEHNLLTSTVNDGTESFVVPTSIPLGTYKLEIKTLVGSYLDASDSYFTIVDPLVVTAPVINITINGSAYDGSTYTTTFGGTARIGWAVTPTSGTTCAAAGIGIDGGSDAVNLSDGGRPWTTPALYTNTTYGIVCSNSAGTTYKYVNINVPAQANTTVAGTTAPAITLNGSSDNSRLSINVEFGRTATFNWSVSPTVGTSCSAAGNGVNGAIGSGAINLRGTGTTPALYANTTYGIACVNRNSAGVVSGTTYKYADVTVAAQTSVTTGGTPTISSINPSSVNTGQTTNFTVTGTNFQSGSMIYYTGTYSGSPGSFTPTFNSYDPTHLTFTAGPLNSGTYTFYVQNPSGQRSGTLNMTVTAPAVVAAPAATAPVINITINGSAYDGSTFTTTFGGRPNIGWTVTPTSGTTCAAAGNGIGGGSGAVNLSGSWTTPLLYANTTYGVVCSNSLGTTYKYVSIGVQAQANTTTTGNPTSPTITLNGSNDSSRLGINVEFGRTATFNWSVTQPTGTVTTCYAAGNGVNGATGSGAINLSGSGTTPALYANTTYGIACSNTNSSGVVSGTTYKYADVTVAAQTSVTTGGTPTISSINPSSVNTGQTTNFTVTGTNFQSGSMIYYTGTYSGSPGSFTPTFNSYDPTHLTFTAGPLNSGTYTFYVQNPDGQRSGTLNLTVTAPAAVTYTAPTLSVSNSNPTAGTTISFTWSAPNGTGCSWSNNGVYVGVLSSSPVSVDTTGLSGVYNMTASCSYPNGQTMTSNQVPVTVAAPVAAPAGPLGCSADGALFKGGTYRESGGVRALCQSPNYTWETSSALGSGTYAPGYCAVGSYNYASDTFGALGSQCYNCSGGAWVPMSSSYCSGLISMVSPSSQTASAMNAFGSAMQSPSPTQETTSGFSYTFTQDMYRGQSGAEVSALQQALKAEGLFAGEATGNFYDVTREAVIAFQIKYGINPTGYVGATTREKLNVLY